MSRSEERRQKAKLVEDRMTLEAEFTAALMDFHQRQLQTKAGADLDVTLDGTLLMRRRLVFKVPGLEEAFSPGNMTFSTELQPLMVTVDGAKLITANPVMYLHHVAYTRVSVLTDATLRKAIEGMQAACAPSRRRGLLRRR